MCLLIKYAPLASEVVMPTHPHQKNKKLNTNGIKPLDPTTNEQKIEQNNILNHTDETRISQ